MNNLTNKVIIVTGGAGLLGKQHCHAIYKAGGTPIIWDTSSCPDYTSMQVDVTNKEAIKEALDIVIDKYVCGFRKSMEQLLVSVYIR